MTTFLASGNELAHQPGSPPWNTWVIPWCSVCQYRWGVTMAASQSTTAEPRQDASTVVHISVSSASITNQYDLGRQFTCLSSQISSRPRRLHWCWSQHTHITATVSACFASLCQICSERRSLPRRHALLSLVVSKVDYCNLVLAGISGNLIMPVTVCHECHRTSPVFRQHNAAALQTTLAKGSKEDPVSTRHVKGKGKGPVLDIVLLHDEHMLSSALQSRNWQLANNWTRGAACRHTTTPISYTRPSPTTHFPSREG